MKKYLVASLVVSTLLQVSAYADDSALSSMPLTQAVAGSGRLVILKNDTISGLDATGSPTFQQYVEYNGDYETTAVGSDPDKAGLGSFTCMATIETTDKDYNPGASIALQSGTSLAWGDSLLDAGRMDTFKDSDGIPYQALRLNFYSTGSKFSQLLCTVKGSEALTTLTIKDFENAMGGRMTLIPASSK